MNEQTGKFRTNMRLRNAKQTSETDRTDDNSTSTTARGITDVSDANSANNASDADTNTGGGDASPISVAENAIDRSSTVTVNSLGKTFPAPDQYDYVGAADDLELYGRAPWFDRDAVLVEGLLDEFVQDEGWLPGGIPLEATRQWCWQNQFFCRDADLVIGHCRTLRGVRAEFAQKVMDGFYRIGTWIAPAAEANTDMFLFRTFTEREYLTNVNVIPAVTVKAWRGTKEV